MMGRVLAIQAWGPQLLVTWDPHRPEHTGILLRKETETSELGVHDWGRGSPDMPFAPCHFLWDSRKPLFPVQVASSGEIKLWAEKQLTSSSGESLFCTTRQFFSWQKLHPQNQHLILVFVHFKNDVRIWTGNIRTSWKKKVRCCWNNFKGWI